MGTTEIAQLGKRIKQLRKLRGLSQAELAEKVGLDSKHISRLEMSRNLPTLETLGRIADALAVDVRDFFERTDDATQKELLSDIKKLLKGATADDLRIIQKFVKVVRRQ